MSEKKMNVFSELGVFASSGGVSEGLADKWLEENGAGGEMLDLDLNYNNKSISPVCCGKERVELMGSKVLAILVYYI